MRFDAEYLRKTFFRAGYWAYRDADEMPDGGRDFFSPATRDAWLECYHSAAFADPQEETKLWFVQGWVSAARGGPDPDER